MPLRETTPIGPFLVDVAGHDADLGLARRDEAGAVRADEPARPAPEEGLDAHHVGDGHALGDADDQRHAGVRRFHDGVGGGRRRHEDERAVGARGLDGLLDRVPDGKAFVGRSALARRDAAHDLRSVLLAAERVEGALLAGDALHEDARRLSTRMLIAAACASSTAFLAPAPMSSAVAKLSPDSASIFLPCSTLVPSIRTTTGIVSPSFFTAAMTPSASRSQRRMPPKTLMNTALTRRIRGQDAEGVLDLLRRGAAAHVEEVGGLAARELDDVHGGHGQARAVDHAADAAVELDVVEAVLRGLDVERRLLVDVAERHDVLVAIERVVVEVELGVERHAPGRRAVTTSGLISASEQSFVE